MSGFVGREQMEQLQIFASDLATEKEETHA